MFDTQKLIFTESDPRWIVLHGCCVCMMYTYVYICFYSCAYTCMYIYVYICLYTCAYTCIQIYINISRSSYSRNPTPVGSFCMDAVYACIYMYIYVCMHVHIYVCIYMYIYVDIHVHIHVYINISRSSYSRNPTPVGLFCMDAAYVYIYMFICM